MSASTAPPTITPRIQGSSAALEDGVAVVEIERRAVVVVAAIVDADVAPKAVEDDDVVVLVAAAVVGAVVVAVAAVQLATGRLEQEH